MEESWILALIGGAIIGLAVSLMLLWTGRVTGISGIVGGTLSLVKGDFAWRACFVLGLILGGGTLFKFHPEFFEGGVSKSPLQTIVAGLLVGFGTTMGSGCTSGHGVCGISRWSKRSILATLCFIAAGILAVAAFKAGGLL